MCVCLFEAQVCVFCAEVKITLQQAGGAGCSSSSSSSFYFSWSLVFESQQLLPAVDGHWTQLSVLLHFHSLLTVLHNPKEEDQQRLWEEQAGVAVGEAAAGGRGGNQPLGGDLPAVDDLGGRGDGAEVASSTASSSSKGSGGEGREAASWAQAVHGGHVTHVVHGSHGAEGSEPWEGAAKEFNNLVTAELATPPNYLGHASYLGWRERSRRRRQENPWSRRRRSRRPDCREPDSGGAAHSRRTGRRWMDQRLWSQNKSLHFLIDIDESHWGSLTHFTRLTLLKSFRITHRKSRQKGLCRQRIPWRRLLGCGMWTSRGSALRCGSGSLR